MSPDYPPGAQLVLLMPGLMDDDAEVGSPLGVEARLPAAQAAAAAAAAAASVRAAQNPGPPAGGQEARMLLNAETTAGGRVVAIGRGEPLASDEYEVLGLDGGKMDYRGIFWTRQELKTWQLVRRPGWDWAGLCRLLF